jgi:WD40 repeat protein
MNSVSLYKKFFFSLSIASLFLTTYGMDNSKYPLPLLLKPAGEECINSLAWSKDEKYLAVTSGSDSRCRIWDVESQKTHILQAASPITTIAWGPHHLLALGLDNGLIEIWDVAAASLCSTLQEDARISLLSWSSDGIYIASLAKNFTQSRYPYANESTINFWHVKSAQSLKSLTLEKHVTALKWSTSGHYIAVGQYDVAGAGAQLSIFTLEHSLLGTGLQVIPLWSCPEANEIYSLEWSPNSREHSLAISLQDGTIAVYRTIDEVGEKQDVQQSWQCSKRWGSSDLKCIVSHINRSADGRYLLSGGIDKVDVWNASTGEPELAKGVPLNNLAALVAQLSKGSFAGEQELMIPQLLAYAPHSSLIATALRQEFKGFFPHILLLFDVHTWYTTFRKLMMREVEGKMLERPFKRTKFEKSCND